MPVWVIPFAIWWFLFGIMGIVILVWIAERNPVGIAAKIVRAFTGEKKNLEEIASPEALFKQPNGVVIEDANGIVLERFDGKWINSRGRVQARIGLPARIIP